MRYLMVAFIFLPGLYTHRDGKRVTQYEKPAAVAALPVPKSTGWSRTWVRSYGPYNYNTYYRREKW